MAVARIVILVLSAGAMVIGALVIVGVLVPRNLPEDFRLITGVVVFLYGLYRFVVEYVRMAKERRGGGPGRDRSDGM
jgi:prolipoprotein diacylglyceryltransferase